MWRRRARDGSLITGEEEELIFLYRSADNSSELVPLQVVPYGREEIPSVEHVVPHEFKSIAVKIVRTGLGYRRNGSGRMKAVLRRQCARLHLELLQRIRKRQGQTQVRFHIVVDRAIQKVGHPIRQPAGHGNNERRIIPDRLKSTLAPAAGGDRRHARQKDQFRHVASIQRHLQNALAIHDCSNHRPSRFHQCGVGLNLDLFRKLTDLQHRVNGGAGIHLQDDSGLRIRAKARQRCL